MENISKKNDLHLGRKTVDRGGLDRLFTCDTSQRQSCHWHTLSPRWVTHANRSRDSIKISNSLKVKVEVILLSLLCFLYSFTNLFLVPLPMFVRASLFQYSIIWNVLSLFPFSFPLSLFLSIHISIYLKFALRLWEHYFTGHKKLT